MEGQTQGKLQEYGLPGIVYQRQAGRRPGGALSDTYRQDNNGGGTQRCGKVLSDQSAADRHSMETGEISTKIERGKHTTRHSELIYVSEDTYIVDTPGFSSIELYGMEKEELQDYFPEFADWEPECRFTGCAHVKERDCGVKTALERGEISRSRYENYCQLYEELKNKRKY